MNLFIFFSFILVTKSSYTSFKDRTPSQNSDNSIDKMSDISLHSYPGTPEGDKDNIKRNNLCCPFLASPSDIKEEKKKKSFFCCFKKRKESSSTLKSYS